MKSIAGQSPAGKVMDEAIELDIEGCSPFPEHSMFIDEDSPHLLEEIKLAAAEGAAIVLVAADCSTEILMPQNGSPAQ